MANRHNNNVGTNNRQEISFSQITEWIQRNPNKSHVLTPIETVKSEEMVTIENMTSFGLPGHDCVSLDPPGPLSLFQWILDPTFLHVPYNGRKAMLRCFATSLQEETESIKGCMGSPVSRKRKRIHELVAQASYDKKFSDEERYEFISLLALMKKVQIILIKTPVSDETGELLFSSNPVEWSSEIPIWIADSDARWIVSQNGQTGVSIHNWLYDRETTGWIIHWPEIDRKKSELVEKLQVLPTWKPTDSKLLKEVLAQRLGKYLTIQTIGGGCR